MLAQFSPAVAVTAVVVALAGCASTDSTSISAAANSPTSADEIIADWGAAACFGAPVATYPGEGDILKTASCELAINGTRTQKTVYLEIYGSPSAVKTKLASVDCGQGFLRVVGPNWYSATLVGEVATALQDEMGGELACT